MRSDYADVARMSQCETGAHASQAGANSGPCCRVGHLTRVKTDTIARPCQIGHDSLMAGKGKQRKGDEAKYVDPLDVQLGVVDYRTAQIAHRTAITPTKVAAVCEMLGKAVPFTTACWNSGVSPYSVRTAARNDATIAAMLAAARAEGELQLIEQHRTLALAGGRTTGIEWLLERLYPQRWHLASRVEVSGRDGAPIETQATVQLTVDEAVRIARGPVAALVPDVSRETSDGISVSWQDDE